MGAELLLLITVRSRVSLGREGDTWISPRRTSSRLCAGRSPILGKRYGHGRTPLTKARAHEPLTELWTRGRQAGLPRPQPARGVRRAAAPACTSWRIVWEELAAPGRRLLMMVVSPAINGTIISRFGTDEQKQRWLPGIADGSHDHGLRHHRTGRRLELAPDHDDRPARRRRLAAQRAQGLRLRRRPGRGGPGRGRTEDAKTGRLKPALFVVPTDTPGFEYTADRHGRRDARHASSCSSWTTSGCPPTRSSATRTPRSRSCSPGSTPSASWPRPGSVGIGRYALDKAVAYANERKVWGQPIGTHQGLSHPLAKAKVEVELAKLMMQKAASLYDSGDDMGAGEAANMAKYAAAEASVACRRPGGADPRRQRPGHRVRPGRPAGRRPAGADRAGQPRDDPELRRPVQPGPAEVLLARSPADSAVAVEQSLQDLIGLVVSAAPTATGAPRLGRGRLLLQGVARRPGRLLQRGRRRLSV